MAAAWLAAGLAAAMPADVNGVGRTELLNWPGGAAAAVSITWDDGSANQFKVAVPILDRLGLPATFFVITGEVKGSKFPKAYAGRPFATILAETAANPTDDRSFLERSSALRHSGYDGVEDLHAHIGEIYEEGKTAEAYRLLDEAYARIRSGALKPGGGPGEPGPMSWDDFRRIAARGHEFASHSVSHPYLSILDDADLAYELEKSREDLRLQLGPRYTYAIECPYGTENARGVKAALNLYPLTRNQMDDADVEDLDRWNDMDPRTSTKRYVRWQRGPLTATKPELMRSWLDTSLGKDNIWLVLVFHGVDGIGWEPLTHQTLGAYFADLASRRPRVWVATFSDAGKAVRERLRASVLTDVAADGITVRVVHDLDPAVYDVPLGVRTFVPAGWSRVRITQGAATRVVTAGAFSGGRAVVYDAAPNREPVLLQAARPN